MNVLPFRNHAKQLTYKVSKVIYGKWVLSISETANNKIQYNHDNIVFIYTRTKLNGLHLCGRAELNKSKRLMRIL